MALKDIAINIKATGGDQAAREMRTAQSATQQMAGAFERAQRQLAGLVGGFTLGAVVRESIQAALAVERMEAAMKATYGSGQAAARELAYVRDEARRLGLVYNDAALAYAKFSASTRNTVLEGEATRKIFSSVSEAVTALKLSGEESNGIFLALSQMMSKGKISAEELSGQLGERLPGAVKLTADAMGLTTQALLKQMQEGKLMSSDVLPKLAEELHKTYGKAAEEAAQGGQAEINRFNNALFETKAALGTALLPTFTSLMSNVLKPLSGFVMEFIGGLEIMAIKLAAIPDRIRAIWDTIKEGKGGVFSARGGAIFDQKLASINAVEEAAIAEVMGKYTPASSAKSDADLSAENARVATAKAAAKAAQDKAAAEEAAKKAAKEADHQYQQYGRTLEGFNKQIRDANPYLDQHEKALLDIDAAVAKAIEVTPQYEKSLRAAGEALKLNINLSKEMKDAVAATSQEFQQYLAAAEAEAPQHNAAGAMNERWEEELKLLASLQPTADADRLNEQLATFERLLSDMPEKAAQVAAAIAQLKQQFADSSGLTALLSGNAELRDKVDTSGLSAFDQQTQLMERAYQRQMELEKAKAKAMQEGSDLYAAQLERITLLEQEHTQWAKKNDEERWMASAAATATAMGQIGELLMQGNKDQFEAGKAMMYGQALIAAALAIVQCYAQLGPIFGTVAAVGVGAATALQIASIADTEYQPRAKGGPVAAGGYYLVGEQGPELIRMGSAGTVIPNHALAQANEAQLKATQANTRAVANLADTFHQVAGSLKDVVLTATNGALVQNRLAGMALPAPEKETAVGRTMDAIGGSATSPFRATFAALDGIKSLFSGNWQDLGASLKKATEAVWSAMTGGWGGSLFGGKVTTEGAGLQLGYQGGSLSALQYQDLKKSGGLFGNAKRWTESAAVDERLMERFRKLSDDIAQSVTTAGQALGGIPLHLDKVALAAEKLDLRGMKEEEATKALEGWFAKLADAMAEKLGGPRAQQQLADATHFGESSYQALMRVTMALQAVREAGLQTGGQLLSNAKGVAIANGELASSLIESLGGLDKFASAVDRYNQVTRSDSEYDAVKLAAAQRQVASTLSSYNVALPHTVAEFRKLVESTDMTSPLYAALLGLSDAFGTIGDAAQAAADKVKAQAALERDLTVRGLRLAGNEDQATLLDLQARQEEELAAAREQGLNVGRLSLLQQKEYAAAVQTIQKAARDKMIAAEYAWNEALLAVRKQELGTWQGISRGISSALDAVRGAAAEAEGGGLALSAARFDKALRRAQHGDADAAGSLSGLSSDYLTALRGSSGSREEYLLAAARLSARLSAAGGAADARVSDAQRQADLLQKQLDLLDKSRGDAVAAAAAALKEARAGYAATLKLHQTAQLSGAQAHNDAMSIVAAITGVKRPGFASGSSFIPADMTADIHYGEKVIDAESSAILSRYGIRVQAADNYHGSPELVAELRALRQEVRELRGEQKAGLLAVAKHTSATESQLRRWDGDGLPETREAAV